MKRETRLRKTISVIVAALSLAVFGLSSHPAVAQVAAPQPFEPSAYLYNTAYDTNLSASGVSQSQITGAWGQYRAWLGGTSMGAEADPGWGNGDWWDCCQHTSWNSPWGTMQQRYGSALPTVLLGMGQMPAGYLPNDGNALDFENAQWQIEASGDTTNPSYNTIMGYFANYAQEVDNGVGGYNPNSPFQKVIIRLGYEFDGYWNPFGNLNSMSNMPTNYVKAWQNIVTTMRANDPKHILKFCWNPTDINVGQITSLNFYPGDGYVDDIGIDEYDVSSNGEYGGGSSQPTQAQQTAAWTNTELPRINVFANFARAHGKQMVVGEWGLWQLNSGTASGGDNPSYIQNMYNWMSDPYNNVADGCYFEAPSNGNSSLSGLFGTTTFPNAAAKYRDLFGTSLSYGTSAAAIPGTVQAVNYDTGGQGIAYAEYANGGQTGYRADNSSADYGSGIGWTYPGQWYKYTVSVAAAGAYTVAFSVASPSGGGTFHLEDKSGNSLTGPVVSPATGDWSTPGTVNATVSLRAGTQVLKWVQDTGGYNLLSMTFTALPNTLLNGSFEKPSVGTGSGAYWYNPTGACWAFAGTSGIQANGSAWNAAPAPNGTQTAFLQGQTGSRLGSLSQPVNFPAAGAYKVTLQIAARPGQIQPVQLALDGVNVGAALIPAGSAFATQSVNLPAVTAGSHVLSLSATDNTSGDNTTFVDNVVLTPAAVPGFTEGFEAGTLNAWSLWVGGNGGAAFAQNCGAAQAHSGTWEYTNWSSSPYQLTLYKSIPVSNGTHVVTAWVKSSGGQYTCQMEVTTNGVETIVPITASAGWTQISTTVNVTTGAVQVGFYSSAAGNLWLNVDDVAVN